MATILSANTYSDWFAEQPVRYYDNSSPTAPHPKAVWQQPTGGVELMSNLYDFGQRELDVLLTDPDLSELESVLSTENTEVQNASEGDDSLAHKPSKRSRTEDGMRPPSQCGFPTSGEVEAPIKFEVGTSQEVKDALWPSTKQSTKKSRPMRGRPWTEEEHKQFLSGLNLFGRGDWRSVSRECLKTRSPTQIASHAQKYFLRQEAKLNGSAGRRMSIHDIRSVQDTLPVAKKRRLEKQSEAASHVPTAEASPITVCSVSLPQHELVHELQSSSIPIADSFPMTRTMPTQVLPPQTTMPRPTMIWPSSVQRLPPGMLVYSTPPPVWVLCTRAAI
jgi:SHAQKYF class myb-like DNA-binding protein